MAGWLDLMRYKHKLFGILCGKASEQRRYGNGVLQALGSFSNFVLGQLGITLDFTGM